MSRLLFTESANVGARAATTLCRYEVMTVSEIVRKACTGDIDIPAFQRGFVWTPAQCRDLADSLWRDYPIGLVLLWESHLPQKDQTTLLVADGQHRIRSLCALFGQTPHWCVKNGNTSQAAISIWFDPVAEEPACPFVADEFQYTTPARRLVFLPRLLSMNVHTAAGQQQLRELAEELAGSGPRPASSANHTYQRLAQACAIADRQVIAAIVRHPRDEVLEIFSRLNSDGIRFRRLLLRTALKATRSLWDSHLG